MRLPIRFPAVWTVLALAATAGAEEKKKYEESGKFQKTFAMPAEGAERVDVNAAVGPLVVEAMLVQNQPNAKEIEIARANETDDKCRPKIAVLVSNKTPLKMKAELKVTLESADGKVYMSCDRNDGVAPYAESDRTNMCWLESLRLVDWPRVKKIRLSVQASRDR